MAAITQTCTKCGKQFLVIDAEQQFLNERGLPMPAMCPADRQARRLGLRGARELFRSKCSKCGKDIVVSFDPQSATAPILCKEDYDRYSEENNPIINEPLPGDVGQQTAPQAVQAPQQVGGQIQPQPVQQPAMPQPQQSQSIETQPVVSTSTPDQNQNTQ